MHWFSARSSRDKTKECMPTLHRPWNSHPIAWSSPETNKCSNQWFRLWTAAETKEPLQMTVSHLLWEQIRPRGWAGEIFAPLIRNRNHLILVQLFLFQRKKKNQNPSQCKPAPYNPFSHLYSSDLKHLKNSERFFIFRHCVLWCNTHLKAATANLSLFVPIHQVVCI